MTSFLGDRRSLETLSKTAYSCPACTGIIRRSERRGWRDLVWYLLGRYPWRCRACNHRFYAAHRQ